MILGIVKYVEIAFYHADVYTYYRQDMFNQTTYDTCIFFQGRSQNEPSTFLALHR